MSQTTIVFGTEKEISFVARAKTLEDAVTKAFPNTKLLVTTRAEQGSVVRFGDQIIPIDPYPVDRVIDETGAGDNFMGMMLGLLFTKAYREWTTEHVQRAAQAGWHPEFCVTVYNEKLLNSVLPWPRSFSVICHYTKNLMPLRGAPPKMGSILKSV